MANEITALVQLKLSNGNLKFPSLFGNTFRFDQTTAKAPFQTNFNAGTSEETLSFGDVTPGYVLLVNTDDTNYIDWGFTTGQLDGRLEPASSATTLGGVALLRLNASQSIIVQADTAACDLIVVAIND